MDLERKKVLHAPFKSNSAPEALKSDLTRLMSLIDDPLKSMRIVVYGKYNHGKSSFLNAWLEQDEFFKVSDRRETLTVQNFEDSAEDITWIDTPGLDADQADNEKAEGALKDADLLLMVHNVNSGELDLSECDFLKKNSGLVKKSILLLTQIDQQEKEKTEKVRSKIEQQVAEMDLKIFSISSTFYDKFRETGKDIWRKESGFDELTPEIRQFHDLLARNRKHEISELVQTLKGYLNSEIAEIEPKIQEIEQKKEIEGARIKEQQSALLDRL